MKPGGELDPDHRRRLDAGEHEAVAAELTAAHRHALAGHVLEQIWEFGAATQAYLRGHAPLDALRTALEARDPAAKETVLQAIEREAEPALVREAVAMLEKRGQHADAARLLERDEGSVSERARALLRAGDPVAGATVLADAGRAREALHMLGPLDERPSQAAALALAARLHWELGDAEGTARLAQAGLRSHSTAPELPRLLARALGTLGHDLAAQVALREQPPEAEMDTVRGRYHVTATSTANLAGAAYVGLDRITLQEVEIHLLLADYTEGDAPDPAVREAISAFARVALAADELGHPAIRPIVRIDEEDGLLVMPRAEGPRLRSLIREPGMAAALPRARAMIAFLLEALVAAHEHGIVHGSILPSQIVCDALGRPLLGPFGVHHLGGLVATRTGGLEEVLSMTAPELRAQNEPREASDVFSVGALYLALLVGNVGGDASELPGEERALIEDMMSEQSARRPSAAQALSRVQVPVADVSRVASGPSAAASPDGPRGRASTQAGLGLALVLTAHASWTDAMLDALAAASDPWLQAILDRDGRTFWLAPWPDGCRGVGEHDNWSALLDPQALSGVDPALADALRHRLATDALVATPSGDFMIALDRLLTR